MPYLKTLQEKRISEIEYASINSAWKKADSIIKSDPYWYQVITPSCPERWANGVIFSALEDHEVEIRVKEVVEEYRSLKLPFKWMIGPNSRPSNLPAILESWGLRRAIECVGMGHEASDFYSMSDGEKAITIEDVSEETVEEYVKTSLLGWENTTSKVSDMCLEIRKSLQDQKGGHRFFLARYNGIAAGTGLLYLMPSLGLLKGSSVLPQYRRRGIYKTLVSYRVNYLIQRHISNVLLLANKDTSTSICTQMGFSTICPITIYHSSPMDLIT